MAVVFPPLPFEGFPLRPHRNGQWYKSVWNPRTKRSEQFYFGTWSDDPKGKRAISDPDIGWLARQVAIRAGVDNLRIERAGSDLCLGELMTRFLTFKRNKVAAAELSLTTLGDYIREVQQFVAFMKAGTPAGGLSPEHFSAYMRHLIDHRTLGRPARKRVRAYVTAFVRYGAKNGWYPMPNMGTDWIAPATDPESMRQARARSGQKDKSEIVLTGGDVDRLLAKAPPSFKALILMGVNCGLGPADLGRLTWDRVSLASGRLIYPRPKTGVMRVGYLWMETRQALYRLRSLKHNREAIERDQDSALVFVTRTGEPYYREKETHANIDLAGHRIQKLAGVAVSNAISSTFGRLAKTVGLDGVSFYRLRHTFKTLGKKARDRETLDLMMGHKDTSTGKVYDHEEINWRSVRRVSRVIHRGLWPPAKRREDKLQQSRTNVPFDGADALAA